MRAIALSALMGALGLQAQAPAPRTGHEVLAAMRARWHGKWYRTLAFSQVTRSIAADGTETKGVWHEALEHPGRLRIDFEPLADKAGLVCTPERIHHFKGGVPTGTQETWNPLLILIGDVYCQELARTIMQLEKLGFDLERMHGAEWRGHACFVVGGAPGDLQANQFWVDRETLLLQRVIHKNPADPKAFRREVQIREYRQVQGFPIADRIDFLRDGQRFFSEDYFDIRVNPDLDPALFDPARFGSVPMPLGSSAEPGKR